MRKYERRRALAIFMCITMILSMTTYAMPTVTATGSNSTSTKETHFVIDNGENQNENPSEEESSNVTLATDSSADKILPSENEIKDIKVSSVASKTATVYTFKNGKYQKIDNHSKSTPLDVSEYDGETLYVMTSSNAQKIYFERNLVINDGYKFGAFYSIMPKEYEDCLETSGNAALYTNRYATLTIQPDIAANTELTLTAKHVLWGENVITIVILDELPDEFDNEIVLDDMTFASDGENITVSYTDEEKIEVLNEEAPFFSDEEKSYHFFDIDSESGNGTSITVSGLADGEDVETVTILHLLDSASAILDAKKNGAGLSYFTVNAKHAKMFQAEVDAAKAATGEDNRVYYTHQPAEMNEDGEVEFYADSFSTYIFVVSFVYGGYQYDLPGKGSIELSDLMQSLQIEKTISEVQNVTSDNDQIVSVKKEEDGDWKITSKEKSSQKVTLTIEYTDGTKTKINLVIPTLKYYLMGNDSWNMGTESTTINPADCASRGQKNRNKVLITADEVANNSNIIIYARPGMAIGFEKGTGWKWGSWDSEKSNNDSYHENGYYEWIWTTDSINYTLLDDVDTETVTDFTLTSNGNSCSIRIYILPQGQAPSKVKDTLSEEDPYEIVTLPITLYNYDGRKFNEYYSTKNNGNWLAFHGASLGVSAHDGLTLPWTTGNLPNSGNVSTGVMEKNLNSNHLPVMASDAQTDLFSKTDRTDTDGTKVYQNVGFEYIYDKTNGYYTYSSNLNHAQFNPTTNLVELYNETLTPYNDGKGGGTNQNSQAGLYPFADINEAERRTDLKNADTLKDWRQSLSDGDGFFQQSGLYAKDLVRTSDASSTVDMHFGLQMEVDFYMPSDRKSDFDEDLIYSFTGDDDLWVYIDDQLVLDIGGAHTAITGTINFTNETVTLGQYAMVEANGNEYTEGDNGYNKTFTFAELGVSIEADAMHTMRVFYLERWSGESNCRMHFNIPIVPSGSVSVTKELTNQDNEKLTVAPDVSYTYHLYMKNTENDDTADDEYALAANMEYTIQGESTKYSTGVDGTFSLKSGQTAVFTKIPRFTYLYVTEDIPNDGYIYVNTDVVINGDTANKITYRYDSIGSKPTKEQLQREMMLNSSISYKFINRMQTQPLTIEKEVVGGANGLLDPNQEFTFELVFTKDCVNDNSLDDVTKTSNGTSESYPIEVTNKNSENMSNDESGVIYLGGTFALQQSQSITLPRVPVNMTFTLCELNPDTANSSFDAPKFTPAQYESGEGTAKVLAPSGMNGSEPVSGSWIGAFDTSETPAIWTIVNGITNTDPFGYGTRENKITVTNQQRFTLNIAKTVKNEAAPDQSFMFTIQGKEDSHTAGYSTTIIIPAEKFSSIAGTSDSFATVSISGLPVGSYTVTEDTNWSWRYELDANYQQSVTVTPGTTDASHTASFQNVRTDNHWFDGEAWCKNIFAANGIESSTNGSHATVNKPAKKMRALKPKETEYNF